MNSHQNNNLKNLLLFLESDNELNGKVFSSEAPMTYTSKPGNEPENKVPETIVQDDADDEPEVSDTELESAIEYDNVHYGEFDKVLEKK